MILPSVTLVLFLVCVRAEEEQEFNFQDAINQVFDDFLTSVDAINEKVEADIKEVDDSDKSREELSKEVDESLVSVLDTFLDEMVEILEHAKEEGIEITNTMKDSIKDIGEASRTAISEISGEIQGLIKDTSNFLVDIISKLGNVVTNLLGSLRELVSCTLNSDKSRVCGDPHFRMWNVNNGTWFDYHGECDLVLVDNPKLSTGQNLKIHVRTKINSWYSYVESAAIQIGEEVLEIQGGKYKVLVNGKGTKQTPTLFAGYPVKEVNITKWCTREKYPDAVTKKIDLGIDGKIVVVYCWGFLYVDVTARGDGFLYSNGLMGKRDQPGKFARNGTIVLDDVSYAEEWQVQDTEPKLFHEDRYPQYPISCIPPPKRIERRSTNMDNLRRRIAESECSNLAGGALDACVYDVEATGDVNMAIPYKVL